MLERLAHYNILGRIGAGGMGELYRARDTRHGRTVALRILPASIREDVERRRRFEEDAARAAALSHPNIAALYESGDDRGELYAAFEFVPGESLKSIVRAGPLNPRRAIQLAAQVADALADAHARGVAHGALTADSVIVTPKGPAKVLDFGFTSWRGGGGEQRSDPDPLEDLRALGRLLSEMLRGASSKGTLAAPPEIEPILKKARATPPEEAYGSAAMFAADLRAADAAIATRADASGGGVDIPPERISRPRSSSNRRAAILVAAIAVVIAAWIARDRVSSSWRRAMASPRSSLVVVLPFDREDGSQDYFSKGLARDVAARLGQTPGVRIVARNVRATAASRADFARRSGAATLTGTIRTSDGRVDLAVTLVDPTSKDVLWQREYTRDLREIFPLHLQVSNDVAGAIGVTVGPTPAAERDAARLVDPAAYDSYLRGLDAAISGRIEEAAAHLARALSLDDGIAEAHAAYAEMLYRNALADSVAADVNRQSIKRAAARAYELAPDLPAASLAVAMAADAFPEALAALKNAVRYDPSYADAYREIGVEIQDVDPERGRQFLRKAQTLEAGEPDQARPAPAGPADACEAMIRSANGAGDRRATMSARQRIGAALERGSRPDAGPFALRCAALSAAALGQAASAGALLKRIASSDAAFRVWTTHASEVTGLRSMNARTFPWSRVSDQTSIAQGRKALEEAYGRARGEIASALPTGEF